MVPMSRRLASMPIWVRGHVLMPELAHLEAPHHGPACRALVSQFPLPERARGYPMGVGLEAVAGDRGLG